MKKKAPKMSPMKILDRLDTRGVHTDRTTLPSGWMKLYKDLLNKKTLS